MNSIILLLILIFLNAVFASAEIAVISMSDMRLKKLADERDKRAHRLILLTEQPARFLATIQVAITLAGLLSSAFAADYFAEPLVAYLIKSGVAVSPEMLKGLSVILITLILAYFNLVFGELVPKRIAMQRSEFLALKLSGLLFFVSKAFAPLVFLLTISTNSVLRLFGIRSDEGEEQVTEEEIRMLLLEGSKQGTIRSTENEIIQNVFEFDDITVDSICTHRLEVVSLMDGENIREWEEIIHNTRHTFYPVCGDSYDDVIGVLNTKDYFRLKDYSRDEIMKYAVDEPFFIPESMRANMLFQTMKQTRRYFAVVLDEYGGLAGIITVHDLIEALVGDLCEQDEEQKEAICEQEDGSFHIYGYASLDEVARKLGIHLPVEKYDTFSGYVCGVMGRIPDDGEQLTCEANGIRVVVCSVVNHIVAESDVTLLTS